MSNTDAKEILSSSSSSPPPPSVDSHQDSGLVEVIEEIKKACTNIVATRYVDPKEAIRQANELCSKHADFSIVHLTRGQLLSLCYLDIHDGDDNKRKFLKGAIDSLRRAVEINPDSAHCSYYLARAYFLWAKLNHADYHCVVQECERGLNIDALSDGSKLEKKTADFEKLILIAKAAQEKQDLDRICNVRRDDQKNARKITELNIRKQERKLERSRYFLKKTGEYWRELSYDEKCRVLDVKVKDVESFYGSWKNKNSQALSVLKEAVNMYREKTFWVTWTCCFCKEDRKKEDFDVWSSIENHIGNHFDDPEPRFKGTSNYNCFGNFDSLDISDGVFVLHNVLDNKRRITRELYNDSVPNNKFLYEWLAKENDVKSQLKLWEERSNRTSETASIIFEQIVKLKEMKAILEKIEKEQQKVEENMKTVASNEIAALEKKIVTLKREALCLSAFDYREIIVPLLKCFIQASLECEADKQARIEADAKMAELIKDGTPKDKNVPTDSKTDKKKRDDKWAKVSGHVAVESEEGSENSVEEDNGEQQERELKEGKELEAREESNQEEHEQESLATSAQECTILIGSIPITLKNPKSKEKEIANEAEEIAREAVEHPSENVDDANEGWIAVTPKNKRKDVDNAEQ